MDQNTRTLSTDASALRWEPAELPRTPSDELSSQGFDDPVQRLAELEQTNLRLTAEIEHQRFLLAEANHRAKNMLALVQAMVNQTLRRAGSTTEASEALTARIAALGDAQNVLTEASGSGARLKEIVQTAMASHGGVSRTGRIQANGPSVKLNECQTLALSLALHELGTNATKHGALSTAAGRVEIAWRVLRQRSGHSLYLRWREHSGPPVATPLRSGFGSKLIQYALADSLGGEVSLFYELDGFVCTVEAPLSAIQKRRL